MKGVKILTRAQAVRIFDRAAQRYWGMSGVEWVAALRRGDIVPSDTPQYLRVGMLLPLVGEREL